MEEDDSGAIMDESQRDRFKREREDDSSELPHSDETENSTKRARTSENDDNSDSGDKGEAGHRVSGEERLRKEKDQDDDQNDNPRRRAGSLNSSGEDDRRPRQNYDNGRGRSSYSYDSDSRRSSNADQNNYNRREYDHGRDDYDSNRRFSRDRDDNRRSRDIYQGPLKSYKQFMDSQEDRSGNNDREKRYEEYKKEYMKRTSKIFFEDHKEDEWFKERYHPTYLEKKRASKIHHANETLPKYIEALKQHLSEIKSNPAPQNQNPSDPSLDPFSVNSDPMKNSPETGDHNSSATLDSAESETSESKSDSKKAEENSGATTDSTSSNTTDSENSKKALAQPNCTIFIKNLPPNIGKSDIVDLFSQVEGIKRVILSEPQRQKGFHRLGWVTYETPEACSKALNQFNNYKIKDFSIQLLLNKPSTGASGNLSDGASKTKITPPAASDPARITKDLQNANNLCKILDKEKELAEGANTLFSNSEDSLKSQYDELEESKKLDCSIAWLRMIHNYCYYCSEEFDDEDDLNRKCGIKHLRNVGTASVEEHGNVTENWANILDERIELRLNHPLDEKDYTAKNRIEQKLEKFHNSNVNVIDKERFRCGICNKLFSGESFVQKHIGVRHPDKIEEVRKKAITRQFLENYLNDPKRITSYSQSSNTPSHVYNSGQRGYQNSSMGRSNNLRSPSGGDRRNMNQQSRDGRNSYGGRNSWGHDDRNRRNRSPSNDSQRRSYGDRQNRSNSRGRNENSGSGSPTLPPPPNLNQRIPPEAERDPRGIREYVDLDAPAEDTIKIDYGNFRKKD